jgi:hypothetical protein
LVGTHELRDRDNLGREGPLQLHASAGREPEIPGHGVELEAVAVAPVPARRAWPAIAVRADLKHDRNAGL